MPSAKPVTIKNSDLRSLMERLIKAGGCKPDTVSTVANVFYEANLRGIPIQGLNHLLGFVRNLKSGKVNPDGKPKLVKEGAGFAMIEGNKGPGVLAGIYAADVAVEKAKKSGFCTVGITNSADIYMVGFYVERIARNGLVGLCFTDATPAVHPTGGMEKMLGTNPIGIAVPTKGGDPIVLDFATSATLLTHIKYAAAHGTKLPPDVAIGPDGKMTTDPNLALQGAVSPLGGHKGFGLGLSVALLSGALVGGAMGHGLAGDKPGPKGHLFMAIDPAAFGDPDSFRKGVSAYVTEVKSSRKAPGVKEIRVPGERSFAERERSLKRGTVEIDPVLWENTIKLAGELGVALPSLGGAPKAKPAAKKPAKKAKAAKRRPAARKAKAAKRPAKRKASAKRKPARAAKRKAPARKAKRRR
ncbi:MAG: Ldh family oxidoreductase [Rhodospirillales bacterium]|nr:Ldh family oxidoreductase [Rhodospirillales bacterium]